MRAYCCGRGGSRTRTLVALGCLALVGLALSAGLYGGAEADSAPGDRAYYVATDGVPGNDGSRERPWPSIEYALEQVGGGHTIMVRPGQYRGPIDISRTYAGTRERPTIIKSEVKWQAVVFGSDEHGIYTADQSHWVIIDGFRVFGSRMDGIKISGDDSTVRNCWVHNNSGMGVAMHGRKRGTIENNLIEFNGHNIQFEHGVYADGDGLIIRGNIVRHNAGFGLQLYPVLTHSVIVQNLVYGHVFHPGIIISSPPGVGGNLIANNTVVERNGCLAIWYGNGETVVNNIFVSDSEVFDFQEGSPQASTKVTVDYNLCVPESNRQGAHAVRGIFWLRPGSPAIGTGAAAYAPQTDFWGRPAAKGRAPDLGAFAFVPVLAADYHRQWGEEGWPYEFRQPMPDLWVMPPEGGR